MCKCFANCTIQPKMSVKPPKGLDNLGRATHEGGSHTSERYKEVSLEEGWKA